MLPTAHLYSRIFFQAHSCGGACSGSWSWLGSDGAVGGLVGASGPTVLWSVVASLIPLWLINHISDVAQDFHVHE